MNSIVFQATDVRKPLAAVSRILDKGNKVVSSRYGSFKQNEKSGRKIELKEENGVFVVEVVFVEPEAAVPKEQDFTSRANSQRNLFLFVTTPLLDPFVRWKLEVRVAAIKEVLQ